MIPRHKDLVIASRFVIAANSTSSHLSCGKLREMAVIYSDRGVIAILTIAAEGFCVESWQRWRRMLAEANKQSTFAQTV